MAERPKRKAPEPAITADQKIALDLIFGAYSVAPSLTGFTVRRSSVADQLNFGHILQILDVVKCEPEELYWNADLDYSGCYYEGDRPGVELQFEIRRGSHD